MLRMMVVGATSAIAHETARNFARDGAQLYLVARNDEKMQVIADDLRAHGAGRVECVTLDMNQTERHVDVFNAAVEAFGGLDALIVAHGTLPEQGVAQETYWETQEAFETNFLSAASMLTVAGNYFEKQRRGVIAVVSSVAGDRGRGSNYIYGAAMAAKTAFVSGLRNRLAKSGVHVLTVKPGFVDTPMTAHLPKNFLFVPAAKVGYDIYRAMRAGRDVIYSPGYWRFIMWVIRLVPEPIFKRLSL